MVRIGGSIIVTFNIKDFPQTALESYEIQAITPDEFSLRLLDVDYHEILNLIKRQRQNMTRPPLTVEEYLTMLERQRLPKAVAFLRELQEKL